MQHPQGSAIVKSCLVHREVEPTVAQASGVRLHQEARSSGSPGPWIAVFGPHAVHSSTEWLFDGYKVSTHNKLPRDCSRMHQQRNSPMSRHPFRPAAATGTRCGRVDFKREPPCLLGACVGDRVLWAESRIRYPRVGFVANTGACALVRLRCADLPCPSPLLFQRPPLPLRLPSRLLRAPAGPTHDNL